MEKKNGVNHSLLENVKSKRRRVIERLQNQLKDGFKSKNGIDKIPLSERDIERIKKEIEILKTRI